jgi:hypothetical protein
MAGTYTDIYAWSPPTSVTPGNRVYLNVYVRNISSQNIYITTQCYVNSMEITMSPEYELVNAGDPKRFTGDFIMPDYDVTVLIRSWYWNGTSWVFDDQDSKTIKATPESDYRNLSIYSYTPIVVVGGTCDITCRFEHIGPSETKGIYAAIGNSGIWGFDEILHASRDIYVPLAQVWTQFPATVKIPITSAISAGIYDIYAKLLDPQIVTDPLKDVVKVESSEPVFSSLSATYRVVG